MAMDADKRNVELGQMITYQGYLYGDYPIEDEIVSISISEKETKTLILEKVVMPESGATEYFENTAWPFTFQVSTSSEEFSFGKTYVVEAKYVDQSTKLEFLIKPAQQLPCLDMLKDNPIIVHTNKENYDRGDTIEISGCLSEDAFTKGINIVVYDPEGTKIGVSTLVPNSDRTFSEEFIIDERFGLNGTYSVEVDAGGLYSSTKSFVVPEFGSVSMLILIIVVTFTIIVTSRAQLTRV